MVSHGRPRYPTDFRTGLEKLETLDKVCIPFPHKRHGLFVRDLAFRTGPCTPYIRDVLSAISGLLR